MEDSASPDGASVGSSRPAVLDPETRPAVARGSAPAAPARSRIDRSAEDAALDCLNDHRREEALKILMSAYGAPVLAFALRVVRDREVAKDIRQQVFTEAFQGIDRFEGRSSLWSWLCGIAHHRCLDELRKVRRAPVDDFDVWDHVGSQPDPVMDDEDRVAKRHALEQCLGKLPPVMRSQLLMRYFLGLSYVEIGAAVGAEHGTVQVRVARILPKLRRCLRRQGIAR